MCKGIHLLLTILLCCLFTSRSAAGEGCLTTQADAGALYIRQLRAAIDSAECQLIEDISYTDYQVQNNEVFDFIIVGAGTAGAVVANRLSENPAWRVLLLEAGGDPTIATEIPGLFPSTFNTTLDWQYRTEPQPSNCLGSVDGRCKWPRGKVLGGCSSINTMLYMRGNPRDYDKWELMGNPGWKYKYMLPYFKKSEDFRAEEVLSSFDSYKYHNKGGLLKVESFKNNIKFFIETFSNTFADLGLPSFVDVNAQNHEGFFTLQGTLENARRCSTAKAFLHDFQLRPNLKISKNSFVTKILVNKKKTAYGVEFAKAGKTYTVRATKEVVLSAGVINTPQLLMLSGIGPQEHLRALGIDVVQNSKVGYNLQDHVLMRGFIVSLDVATLSTNATDDIFEFLINQKGNLAGVNLFSATGFIQTSQALYPNIQMYLTSFPANATLLFKRALITVGFNDDIQRSILDINTRGFSLILMPSLLQPKSRGRILLKTKNPLDYPLIYPGYFTEEQDIEDVLEAIQFANQFVRTKTMRNLGARVERIDIPRCRSFVFQSNEYWRCVIKEMSVSVYHPVGTCKMGPREDPDSVVDTFLRVRGVRSLRVVDASIMPTITSGGITAPTIAIGEKGSDLIKQFWRVR